jgi:hypothetical protein
MIRSLLIHFSFAETILIRRSQIHLDDRHRKGKGEKEKL